MEQPLGSFVGNSLEVEECLAILKNKPLRDIDFSFYEDTKTLSLELAGTMIYLAHKATSPDDGKNIATKILASGKAYEKFEQLCQIQGGDLNALPKAKENRRIVANNEGYLTAYNTEKIGIASILLGAGRAKSNDIIDPSAGIQIHKKIGDKVQKGDPLFSLYFNQNRPFEQIQELLLDATVVADDLVKTCDLIKLRIVN